MKALAMVLVVALAGCAQEVNEASTRPDAVIPEAPYEGADFQWSSEFLSHMDDDQRFEFEVPNGTTEVEGILTWSTPGAVLDFAFFDPSGRENGNGWGESDSHRYVTSTYDVVPGMWTAVVSIERGVDADFDLAVEARLGQPYGPISGTYEVPANDFAEINLNMVPGDFFNFTWSASSEVYFNVHFHSNGTTDRPIETTATALDGRFVAPANEVYSMLWRNQGVLPVTVTFEVDGAYRLHSMTRDAP